MKKCLICLSLLFSFFIIGSVNALTTLDGQEFPDFPNKQYNHIIIENSNSSGYSLLENPNGGNMYIYNGSIYNKNQSFKVYDLVNDSWVVRSGTKTNIVYQNIIATTVDIYSSSSLSSVSYSRGYNLFESPSFEMIFSDTSGYYKNGFYFNQSTIDYIWNQLFEGKSYNYYTGLNYNLIASNYSSSIYFEPWKKEDFPNLACQYMNNSYFRCLFLEDLDNMNFSKNSDSYFYYSNTSSKYGSYPGFKFTTSTGEVSTYITSPSSFGYNNSSSSSWTTNFDVINKDTGVIYKNKVFDYDSNPPQTVFTVNFHINGGNVIDLSNPLVPNFIELDYQIETTTEELEEYLGNITIYKDNNTFGGWYYDSEFTQPYTPGDTLSSDIDLYAKWIPNPEITFHLNEGYIRIYDSESSNNNSGTSGGGSSSGGGRHEDQLITEDFSIKLPIDKINDYIESLIVEKSSMIFEGWYYDKNFNNPYHVGDNITTDTHLYAKYRYERVEDFLNNTTFTEYTFDTNYGYAIITRGSNSGDIYLGLNTNNYDITVYAYNENLNTYLNEQGYCLTPIYSKDNKYYYLLNGDTTNYLNVLVLPKTTFENGNYNFLLTNNANITYTNNLEEVIIYDENGNQITTDLSNTYNIFENSMINDEKDLIGIFKRLINFKDNKVFENINTVWNKLKATDLYIYFMILIVGTLIIMIIKGARRN